MKISKPPVVYGNAKCIKNSNDSIFMPQHIKPYPVMFPTLLVLHLACTTSCKRKWSCQEKGASNKYFMARGKENKQTIS